MDMAFSQSVSTGARAYPTAAEHAGSSDQSIDDHLLLLGKILARPKRWIGTTTADFAAFPPTGRAKIFPNSSRNRSSIPSSRFGARLVERRLNPSSDPAVSIDPFGCGKQAVIRLRSTDQLNSQRETVRIQPN